MIRFTVWRVAASQCYKSFQEGSWYLSVVSVEAELCEAVRLLALPGKNSMFEVGAPGKTADRMAHRFDEAYTRWVSRLHDLPHAALLESLQRIDSALLELARPGYRALWTDEELCGNAAWQGVRGLASDALAHLERTP